MGKDLNRFTTKLSQQLHCAACLEAAYPPVVVCSSEHLLCEACVGQLRIKDDSPQCSTCLEDMPSQTKVSPGLKRLIESYGYRCEKQGCTWVGSVADADAAHGSECLARSIECFLCSESYPLNLQAEHEADCHAVVIFCPRGGPDCGGELGGGTRMRCRMSEHTRQCTSYQCKIDGCTTRTTLANLASHELSCRTLHDDLYAARSHIASLLHERDILEEDNVLPTNALADLRVEHAEQLAALRIQCEAEKETLRWTAPCYAPRAADPGSSPVPVLLWPELSRKPRAARSSSACFLGSSSPPTSDADARKKQRVV